MNQISIDQFLQSYGKLPEKMRSILFDERTTDEMGYIQEKYKMNSEEINALARIVGLTMLGIAPINRFVLNIKEFVELNENMSRSVAHDVNERLFQPVREELLQVHGIQAGGEVAQESPGVAAPEAQTMTTEQPELRPEPLEEHKAPAMPAQNDAAQKREELLARLKAAQDAPIAAPAPQTPPQEPEQPKPVTAAWNGKTIDLTKIPPRRQLNGNGKKNDEEEIKTVQLKKGPDGYWYEI